MMADEKEIRKLLNIAKGQIDGLLKMVDNNEYCITISNQLLASIAILKKANNQILESHLKHCILNSKKEELEERMDEISTILKKVSK